MNYFRLRHLIYNFLIIYLIVLCIKVDYLNILVPLASAIHAIHTIFFAISISLDYFVNNLESKIVIVDKNISIDIIGKNKDEKYRVNNKRE